MAINTDIFLGSGANLALVPETDLIFQIDASESSDLTNLHAVSGFLNSYSFVEDIYVGCVVDFFNADVSLTVPASTHTITSNDSDSITISPSIASTVTLASDDSDFVIIRSYGAPCVGQKNGTVKRLNADNWLGILEASTFPNVEAEVKQMNIGLGTTRNMEYQYKGMETASGGSLGYICNHGAFLYYALGSCSHVECTTTAPNPSNHLLAGTAGDVYIDNGDAGGGNNKTQTHLSQGPIFYKTGYGATGVKGVALTPPLLYNLDLTANVELLTRTTTTATALTNAITYTFAESNGEELPSFSLEQSLSKLESSSTFITGDTGIATESHNFVRIARGNRVNTLTLTANENEELKMTMDLNSRTVHKLKTDESYEARGGAGDDNNKLFNLNDTTDDAEFLEPFFFSSGSFTIFGQEFLKITNLSLTINNNIQDKRFVGIGNKQIKDGIPANRNYELTFTALVTDNRLFEEIFDQAEQTGTTLTADNGLIQLLFTKGNTEQIKLQFKNYMLGSANVTIPDDKSSVTVEATVMPRDLHLCEVTTHWVLQG
tara:strand:+ start:1218 stop:2858 length:1641 start_codon:yes stop_codon:yes gene_type:complete